ncbi:MAG: hypothetical protein AAGA44_13220 [Pseudomonadota bacterium]
MKKVYKKPAKALATRFALVSVALYFFWLVFDRNHDGVASFGRHTIAYAEDPINFVLINVRYLTPAFVAIYFLVFPEKTNDGKPKVEESSDN